VTSENTVGPKEFYAEDKNGNVGYPECDSGEYNNQAHCISHEYH